MLFKIVGELMKRINVWSLEQNIADTLSVKEEIPCMPVFTQVANISNIHHK